jgi:hypothetical protein
MNSRQTRRTMHEDPPSHESPAHPAALPGDELVRQCRVERLRRSGPGGQHRNKVETGVRLLHPSTGVTAEAFERRSQGENRRVALRRLRVNLAMEVRFRRSPEGGPSPLWQSRSGGGRIDVSASHADFPSLLAEALDFVAAAEGDIAPAAAALGCTASQLLKLLKKEPPALVLVNRWRADRGLGRLR